MGQNLENGLNGINDVAADYALAKSGSAAASSDKTSFDKYKNKDVQADFEASYRYDRKDIQSAASASIMDNFGEYIKQRNEQAKQEGTDEAAREREERENEKELLRSLSGDELKQLKLMGVDVEGAKLSDISGIVNTMRGNAHRERTRQILDSVIDGRDAAGQEALPFTDMAGTLTDMPEITVGEDGISDIGKSDEAFLYIVKNDIPMTADNMYKAFYSGSSRENGAKTDFSEALLSQIEPQIDKIIEQAGYAGDERAMDGAKLLLGRGLPVTTDTIKAYMDYTDEDFVPVADAAELTERAAESLYDKVNSITPDIVYEMTLANREVTVASAYSYYKNKISGGEAYDNGYADSASYGGAYAQEVRDDSGADDGQSLELAAVTGKRRIEEIRLAMTSDAARRLAAKDINIETRELSKIVDELKNMERELIDRQLRNSGLEATEENERLYSDLSSAVSRLSEAPAAVVAMPLNGRAFTVNSLLLGADDVYKSMPSETVSGRGFETVRRSYEAVGTAPRYDMGDSISKAFSNVDDILNELDMSVNEETRRAVRILGYNSIEITGDNINKVQDYDRQVNELIQGFYPEAVLSSIKDGINPLDMEIGELNEIIREKNYNGGVTEAENFATYLRDVESRNGITKEERESYIGIYRVMNKLAASGDREAGYLFANGGRLTVRNLISAMRSRRAAGLDVKVDDDFGMLDSVSADGRRIDEQIDSAFAAERFMEENNIEYSLVNAGAAESIISDTGIYRLVYNALAGLKFTDTTKENSVDEETENMSKSMLGTDIPIEFTPDGILESLRRGTDMSLTYKDMSESLTELMYSAGAAGTISSMDISAIKTVQAGFNILAKMAKNDKYQVPVETEDGIRIVNITVRHDEGTRGTVELETSGVKMGSVSAAIRLDEDGVLSGHIISDMSEGNELLSEAADRLKELLAAAGYNADKVSIGTVDRTSKSDAAQGGAPSAEDIYGAAVSLVKAVGAVLK